MLVELDLVRWSAAVLEDEMLHQLNIASLRYTHSNNSESM
jgi:hypothetical protein